MAESGFLKPPEVAKAFVAVGQDKAAAPMGKMFLLSLLAGVYIGFGAHLATTVSTGNGEFFGFTKFLAGASFTVGLMLVVVAGAELFTGNNLMTIALCSRSIVARQMLRNWVAVYIGNLLGSIILALIVARGSGLLAGPVGATALKIAAAKTTAESAGGVNHNLAFFCRGIACNWLVCLAIVLAMASKDITGKLLGIFFPIMAFVASGFEHSVANMYFIPAGIFAKSFEAARAAAGLSQAQLDAINWTTMWTQNLFSVTLGNLVGGGVFAGIVYFWVYVRGTEVCKPQG